MVMVMMVLRETGIESLIYTCEPLDVQELLPFLERP